MPIKHGLYSKVKSRRLRALIERVRGAGRDHLNLKGEVELLRALILNFCEQAECDELPDPARLALLIDHLRKTVETSHRIDRPGFVPIHSVLALKKAMARVVAGAVKTGDPGLDDRILQAIEENWMRIQVREVVN